MKLIWRKKKNLDFENWFHEKKFAKLNWFHEFSFEIISGTALCELKCYDKAFEEFKAADRILPNNPGIMSNIERMNSLLNNDGSNSSSSSSESETH